MKEALYLIGFDTIGSRKSLVTIIPLRKALRGGKAQLGQFLSPMDGRGIASDTIYYQPLKMGERTNLTGRSSFSVPSPAVAVKPPIAVR